MIEHTYTRTVCACERCRACCKRQPGSLIPSDVERIIQHREAQGFDRELAFQWFKKHFWASPGALVKSLLTGRTIRIGTITPRWHKGKCVFLDENERCKIHQVAPFGCSHFDNHMSDAEGNERSLFMVEKQSSSQEYQTLRAELPFATHHKPFGRQ